MIGQSSYHHIEVNIWQIGKLQVKSLSDIKIRLFEKNKIRPFAAPWMEPETLILSEVRQKEKDKYHMISLISEIQCMAQMNLSTEKKQSHGHGEETCGCQGGGGGSGMDWEFGVSRCKLLHLEWISNEILLYSTGNCI